MDINRKLSKKQKDFLITPSTLRQRLPLHLASHHHTDSKQAFVPGCALSSGRNSQQKPSAESTGAADYRLAAADRRLCNHLWKRDVYR
ncbi:hypothetical protein EYF80_031861 [Liparis tanakae]|uniref:Uncharacterized protein n=1 Tax=Liparis tanakae TaxID=230148 RepID=A0A4Z2GXW2_9TELE|nr:hypothetical protein EYF80_031861 [Liparis tanakae]